MKPHVSIVIPAKDEAESLPELVDQIRSVCETNKLHFEAWIIDDGSKDDSWAVISQLQSKDARFKGVRFARNYGKSAALSVGFARATGNYVVTMDADLQDDPAEVPEMIQMLENGLDLVSGWKKKRNDPLGKTIPSKLYNYGTRLVSGIPLHDFNCGLKAYRVEVVKMVKVYGELHRYIPLLAKWEGFTRIGEKVVNHRARKFGHTKFGWERGLRGFLDLITLSFLTRFAIRPMHFFGGLGLLAFFIGFLIGAWLSVEKIFWLQPIGDRPLLMLAMLLMLLGAQSFMTGLLGEMLLKPTLEGNEQYQIREETSTSD
ncbi:MAG: glycosyltransferase family 2 protein [Bacteroidetes Order II. Incertae sedis bacterium]|nr:glycosyltransferase family 2 protein [Bacteroidetes Order II. bacterium]